MDWQWIILVIFIQAVSVIKGRGFIETNFIEFENFEGRRFDGKCCDKYGWWSSDDSCSDECDHSFVICMGNSTESSSMAACEFGKKEIDTVGGNKITFNGNVGEFENPVKFPFSQWPGVVKLKIDVQDEDDDEYDFVDHYEYQYNTRDLRRETEATTKSLVLTGSRTRFNLELKVFCDLNNFGPDCGTFCEETDDDTGHFRCDPVTGDKLCMSGWTGNDCLTNIDDCAGNSCSYGSTCIDGLNFYTCRCPPGRTGHTCQAEINECASRPCKNGGRCKDASNSFRCDCRPGFVGLTCEIELDECMSGPCLNGGECTDGLASFTCSCLAGFEGHRCEIDIDECELSPCVQAERCVNQPGDFRCECFPGFTGKLCEANINECYSDPCQNGGICIDEINSYTCNCVYGFTGSNCDQAVDFCKPNFCANGATCLSTTFGFVCECPEPFTGVWCEMDRNECEEFPGICGDNGRCVNLIGNHLCECNHGFEGRACEIDSDECNSVETPCLNGGTCIDLIGKYKCECPNEYSGDFCEKDFNECDNFPDICSNNGTCANLFGNYSCDCKEGYEGRSCEIETDECINVETPCMNGGTCIDLIGKYNCECPKGFTGEICETDVYECASSPCLNWGVCIDIVNGYFCTCPLSYTGEHCETQTTTPVSTTVSTTSHETLPSDLPVTVDESETLVSTTVSTTSRETSPSDLLATVDESKTLVSTTVSPTSQSDLLITVDESETSTRPLQRSPHEDFTDHLRDKSTTGSGYTSHDIISFATDLRDGRTYSEGLDTTSESSFTEYTKTITVSNDTRTYSTEESFLVTDGDLQNISSRGSATERTTLDDATYNGILYIQTSTETKSEIQNSTTDVMETSTEAYEAEISSTHKEDQFTKLDILTSSVAYQYQETQPLELTQTPDFSTELPYVTTSSEDDISTEEITKSSTGDKIQIHSTEDFTTVFREDKISTVPVTSLQPGKYTKETIHSIPSHTLSSIPRQSTTISVPKSEKDETYDLLSGFSGEDLSGDQGFSSGFPSGERDPDLISDQGIGVDTSGSSILPDDTVVSGSGGEAPADMTTETSSINTTQLKPTYSWEESSGQVSGDSKDGIIDYKEFILVSGSGDLGMQETGTEGSGVESGEGDESIWVRGDEKDFVGSGIIREFPSGEDQDIEVTESAVSGDVQTDDSGSGYLDQSGDQDMPLASQEKVDEIPSSGDTDESGDAGISDTYSGIADTGEVSSGRIDYDKYSFSGDTDGEASGRVSEIEGSESGITSGDTEQTESEFSSGEKYTSTGLGDVYSGSKEIHDISSGDIISESSSDTSEEYYLHKTATEVSDRHFESDVDGSSASDDYSGHIIIQSGSSGEEFLVDSGQFEDGIISSMTSGTGSGLPHFFHSGEIISSETETESEMSDSGSGEEQLFHTKEIGSGEVEISDKGSGGSGEEHIVYVGQMEFGLIENGTSDSSSGEESGSGEEIFHSGQSDSRTAKYETSGSGSGDVHHFYSGIIEDSSSGQTDSEIVQREIDDSGEELLFHSGQIGSKLTETEISGTGSGEEDIFHSGQVHSEIIQSETSGSGEVPFPSGHIDSVITETEISGSGSGEEHVFHSGQIDSEIVQNETRGSGELLFPSVNIDSVITETEISSSGSSEEHIFHSGQNDSEIIQSETRSSGEELLFPSGQIGSEITETEISDGSGSGEEHIFHSGQIESEIVQTDTDGSGEELLFHSGQTGSEITETKISGSGSGEEHIFHSGQIDSEIVQTETRGSKEELLIPFEKTDLGITKTEISGPGSGPDEEHIFQSGQTGSEMVQSETSGSGEELLFHSGQIDKITETEMSGDSGSGDSKDSISFSGEQDYSEQGSGTLEGSGKHASRESYSFTYGDKVGLTSSYHIDTGKVLTSSAPQKITSDWIESSGVYSGDKDAKNVQYTEYQFVSSGDIESEEESIESESNVPKMTSVAFTTTDIKQTAAGTTEASAIVSGSGELEVFSGDGLLQSSGLQHEQEQTVSTDIQYESSAMQKNETVSGETESDSDDVLSGDGSGTDTSGETTDKLLEDILILQTQQSTITSKSRDTEYMLTGTPVSEKIRQMTYPTISSVIQPKYKSLKPSKIFEKTTLYYDNSAEPVSSPTKTAIPDRTTENDTKIEIESMQSTTSYKEDERFTTEKIYKVLEELEHNVTNISADMSSSETTIKPHLIHTTEEMPSRTYIEKSTSVVIQASQTDARMYETHPLMNMTKANTSTETFAKEAVTEALSSVKVDDKLSFGQKITTDINTSDKTSHTKKASQISLQPESTTFESPHVTWDGNDADFSDGLDDNAKPLNPWISANKHVNQPDILDISKTTYKPKNPWFAAKMHIYRKQKKGKIKKRTQKPKILPQTKVTNFGRVTTKATVTASSPIQVPLSSIQDTSSSQRNVHETVEQFKDLGSTKTDDRGTFEYDKTSLKSMTDKYEVKSTLDDKLSQSVTHKATTVATKKTHDSTTVLRNTEYETTHDDDNVLQLTKTFKTSVSGAKLTSQLSKLFSKSSEQSATTISISQPEKNMSETYHSGFHSFFTLDYSMSNDRDMSTKQLSSVDSTTYFDTSTSTMSHDTDIKTISPLINTGIASKDKTMVSAHPVEPKDQTKTQIIGQTTVDTVSATPGTGSSIVSESPDITLNDLRASRYTREHMPDTSTEGISSSRVIRTDTSDFGHALDYKTSKPIETSPKDTKEDVSEKNETKARYKTSSMDAFKSIKSLKSTSPGFAVDLHGVTSETLQGADTIERDGITEPYIDMDTTVNKDTKSMLTATLSQTQSILGDQYASRPDVSPSTTDLPKTNVSSGINTREHILEVSTGDIRSSRVVRTDTSYLGHAPDYTTSKIGERSSTDNQQDISEDVETKTKHKTYSIDSFKSSTSLKSTSTSPSFAVDIREVTSETLQGADTIERDGITEPYIDMDTTVNKDTKSMLTATLSQTQSILGDQYASRPDVSPSTTDLPKTNVSSGINTREHILEVSTGDIRSSRLVRTDTSYLGHAPDYTTSKIGERSSTDNQQDISEDVETKTKHKTYSIDSFKSSTSLKSTSTSPSFAVDIREVTSESLPGADNIERDSTTDERYFDMDTAVIKDAKRMATATLSQTQRRLEDQFASQSDIPPSTTDLPKTIETNVSPEDMPVFSTKPAICKTKYCNKVPTLIPPPPQIPPINHFTSALAHKAETISTSIPNVRLTTEVDTLLSSLKKMKASYINITDAVLSDKTYTDNLQSEMSTSSSSIQSKIETMPISTFHDSITTTGGKYDAKTGIRVSETATKDSDVSSVTENIFLKTSWKMPIKKDTSVIETVSSDLPHSDTTGSPVSSMASEIPDGLRNRKTSYSSVKTYNTTINALTVGINTRDSILEASTGAIRSSRVVRTDTPDFDHAPDYTTSKIGERSSTDNQEDISEDIETKIKHKTSVDSFKSSKSFKSTSTSPSFAVDPREVTSDSLQGAENIEIDSITDEQYIDMGTVVNEDTKRMSTATLSQIQSRVGEASSTEIMDFVLNDTSYTDSQSKVNNFSSTIQIRTETMPSRKTFLDPITVADSKADTKADMIISATATSYSDISSVTDNIFRKTSGQMLSTKDALNVDDVSNDLPDMSKTPAKIQSTPYFPHVADDTTTLTKQVSYDEITKGKDTSYPFPYSVSTKATVSESKTFSPISEITDDVITIGPNIPASTTNQFYQSSQSVQHSTGDAAFNAISSDRTLVHQEDEIESGGHTGVDQESKTTESERISEDAGESSYSVTATGNIISNNLISTVGTLTDKDVYSPASMPQNTKDVKESVPIHTVSSSYVPILVEQLSSSVKAPTTSKTSTFKSTGSLNHLLNANETKIDQETVSTVLPTTSLSRHAQSEDSISSEKDSYTLDRNAAASKPSPDGAITDSYQSMSFTSGISSTTDAAILAKSTTSEFNYISPEDTKAPTDGSQTASTAYYSTSQTTPVLGISNEEKSATLKVTDSFTAHGFTSQEYTTKDINASTEDMKDPSYTFVPTKRHSKEYSLRESSLQTIPEYLYRSGETYDQTISSHESSTRSTNMSKFQSTITPTTSTETYENPQYQSTANIDKATVINAFTIKPIVEKLEIDDWLWFDHIGVVLEGSTGLPQTDFDSTEFTKDRLTNPPYMASSTKFADGTGTKMEDTFTYRISETKGTPNEQMIHTTHSLIIPSSKVTGRDLKFKPTLAVQTQPRTEIDAIHFQTETTLSPILDNTLKKSTTELRVKIPDIETSEVKSTPPTASIPYSPRVTLPSVKSDIETTTLHTDKTMMAVLSSIKESETSTLPSMAISHYSDSTVQSMETTAAPSKQSKSTIESSSSATKFTEDPTRSQDDKSGFSETTTPSSKQSPETATNYSEGTLLPLIEFSETKTGSSKSATMSSKGTKHTGILDNMTKFINGSSKSSESIIESSVTATRSLENTIQYSETTTQSSETTAMRQYSTTSIEFSDGKTKFTGGTPKSNDTTQSSETMILSSKETSSMSSEGTYQLSETTQSQEITTLPSKSIKHYPDSTIQSKETTVTPSKMSSETKTRYSKSTIESSSSITNFTEDPTRSLGDKSGYSETTTPSTEHSPETATTFSEGTLMQSDGITGFTESPTMSDGTTQFSETMTLPSKETSSKRLSEGTIQLLETTQSPEITTLPSKPIRHYSDNTIQSMKTTTTLSKQSLEAKTKYSEGTIQSSGSTTKFTEDPTRYLGDKKEFSKMTTQSSETTIQYSETTTQPPETSTLGQYSTVKVKSSDGITKPTKGTTKSDDTTQSSETTTLLSIETSSSKSSEGTLHLSETTQSPEPTRLSFSTQSSKTNPPFLESAKKASDGMLKFTNGTTESSEHTTKFSGYTTLFSETSTRSSKLSSDSKIQFSETATQFSATQFSEATTQSSNSTTQHLDRTTPSLDSTVQYSDGRTNFTESITKSSEDTTQSSETTLLLSKPSSKVKTQLSETTTLVLSTLAKDKIVHASSSTQPMETRTTNISLGEILIKVSRGTQPPNNVSTISGISKSTTIMTGRQSSAVVSPIHTQTPVTYKRSFIRHKFDLTSNNTYPHPRKEIYEYNRNTTLVKGKARLTLHKIKVTVIRGVSSAIETGKKVVLRTYQRVKNITTSLTVTTYNRARQLLKVALDRVEALWQYCQDGINHYIVKPLLDSKGYIKERFENAYVRLGEVFKRGKLIFKSTADDVREETQTYFESLSNYYTGVYRQYSKEVRDIFESLKIPET